MKALLDTHVWLWSQSAPDKISKEVRALMSKGENELWLSLASVWEISIKYAKGGLSLPQPPELYVPPRLIHDRISMLPIETAHAYRVATLPLHHGDPFDRMLIAQAILEELPIITVDPVFNLYPVRVIHAAQ